MQLNNKFRIYNFKNNITARANSQRENLRPGKKIETSINRTRPQRPPGAGSLPCRLVQFVYQYLQHGLLMGVLGGAKGFIKAISVEPGAAAAAFCCMRTRAWVFFHPCYCMVYSLKKRLNSGNIFLVTLLRLLLSSSTYIIIISLIIIIIIVTIVILIVIVNIIVIIIFYHHCYYYYNYYYHYPTTPIIIVTIIIVTVIILTIIIILIIIISAIVIITTVL